MLGVGEAFVTDEEPAADPIQRVVASAPMTERFLLHTAAGIIDGLVRQADRVEVIDHDRRVEPVGEPGRIPRNGSMTATSIASTHSAGRSSSQS